MAVFDLDFLAEANAEGGSGRYVNLSKIEGERRFRFIGEGISGFYAWNTDNKPVRWEVKPAEIPENIKPDLNGSREAKRFLASLVWDYEEEDFRIMEINQISLMKMIFKYMSDEDYGDLTNYDVKIIREKKNDKITYTLLPAPPKPLKSEIAKAYEEVECNLHALFDGKDPWAAAAA
jgi:hypothetical protein